MTRYLAAAAALVATGASVLTPESMLSVPRRGVATANPSGSVAFFTTTQYSFEDQERTAELQLIDLKTGNITNSGWNASEINELVWIPESETEILYINGTNEEVPGGVTLWIGDITKPGKGELVASLDAPYNGLRVAKTKSGDLHFVVNTLAYQNGSAYNPELAETAKHTGRLYSNVYPRHWDAWLTKQRYAVFGGALLANSSYSLASGSLHNYLHGINFTLTRPECPVQPFGGNTDYDISPDGATIAFLSKATHLNKAEYTASYIYVGPFDGSELPAPINGVGSEAFEAGHQGASGAPTFSPDGSKIAYFQQDGDYYESDRSQLYVADVSGGEYGTGLKALSAGFDRSISSIHWAPNGESIYVTAEDYALVRAFNIPLSADESFVPKNLTSVTSVTDFTVLSDSSLFVSASSIWTSRDFYTLSKDGKQNLLFSSTEADEALAGLGPHLYSEIFYDGSLKIDQQLHAMVVKPSNFVENKTYPLAYIIHGGPQGANANIWSYRWNFQLWADQGYIVVAPNPTGSTGFGQYLTDAIQGNWGSYPYEDIVLAYKHVEENLDFVDLENGICAGASYGGFMTNWIQGHDLGRKFKALVTHDGISQTLSAYSSEELWFMRHDFNGTIYDKDTTYEEWNPMNFVDNWATPQFVIHNTLDYRLPESDGLQLFNILQSKGIPSRFLNFPDENHWVQSVENSLFWNTEIFNWINHWSKGEDLDDEAIGE